MSREVKHHCGAVIDLNVVETKTMVDKHGGEMLLGECTSCGGAVIVPLREIEPKQTYGPCPKCGGTRLVHIRTPGQHVPIHCDDCGFRLERRNWPKVAA